MEHCPNYVNHCVQAVGVDDSAVGGYWKVRNSYGPHWGESGYIRLVSTVLLYKYKFPCIYVIFLILFLFLFLFSFPVMSLAGLWPEHLLHHARSDVHGHHICPELKTW